MYKTGASFFRRVPFFVLPFLEVLFMKVLPQQLRLYAVTDRTWLNGRALPM